MAVQVLHIVLGMAKLWPAIDFVFDLVAKFNDVCGHHFVTNYLKLRSFWHKTRIKTAKSFFCCGPQCCLSFENWPANKKSGLYLCVTNSLGTANNVGNKQDFL